MSTAPSTPPLDTRSPFHRTEALAAGLTDWDLRGSRFQTILRGVDITSAIRVTWRHRSLAALKAVPAPDAHLSHVSAARAHGVPVPAITDEHVTVSRPEDRRRTAGVRCHVAPTGDVVWSGSARVSSSERTFVELASQLGLVDLVVAGDSMVRWGHASLTSLENYLDGCTLPGVRAARKAFAHVRERVDSPMESRLRMLLVLAGLPEPEVNMEIRLGDGTVARRYDLCWKDVRVIVEYDGRQHVEVRENWENDLKRREAIDEDGWRIIVITASGVYKEPGETVRRVFTVLKARRLPGLPARPSEQWRPHFERS
ncbi:very-short-patch-repair endonuclease [Nocardioides daedukensis]|uniref:Very-short-patch-repair endonuclease n=1 Tax=Nocardioides daedukensis TaxID=634462 RepID=A0A7Y9S5E0_9ACTN|nr:DUF559 domain-containing protein [Nocardioides daedukensis]NYG59750.1 very-short-patch-repair endonuclease [Nocardioides daedukensis]